LLRPWSDQRVLYRDAQWCLVDKPAGVPGGAALDAGSGSLGERLRLHGVDVYSVPFAVPLRASGVSLVALVPTELAGTAGLPAGVQHATYVVAVDGCRLPKAGQLRLSGGGSAAPLQYRARRRNGQRALIELRAAVGPDVVLRTLAEHGHPVVGDVAAGGQPSTRLFLHVSGVFGSVQARAPLPSAFETWLAGEVTVSADGFEAVMEDAGVSRWALSRSRDAFRLMGEGAGEVSGLTVDHYAGYAVVAVSTERAEAVVPRLAAYLMDRGALGVYLKRRVRADLRRLSPETLAPPEPLVGRAAPAELSVRQGEVSLSVSLGDGQSTGLFLDQQANWERVARGSREGRLLNLFCYTGAFTLFAAQAGVRSSVSVDLSARALARLSSNLERNALSGAQHRLLKHDAVRWLERASRSEERFDWIVLDPPSFGTRGRGVLSAERDYAGLVRGAAALLAPRGNLLCVGHQRGIDSAALKALVVHACQSLGRAMRAEECVGGWDCPTVPGVSSTKSVLVRMS
jgi:23S rRNA (cytosine1962-C5)-methyltransferase